jgi:hypothetical protein
MEMGPSILKMLLKRDVSVSVKSVLIIGTSLQCDISHLTGLKGNIVHLFLSHFEIQQCSILRVSAEEVNFLSTKASAEFCQPGSTFSIDLYYRFFRFA